MNKDTIEGLIKEKAEYIVSLTGFGTALHVNDILPDLKEISQKSFHAGLQRALWHANQLADPPDLYNTAQIEGWNNFYSRITVALLTAPTKEGEKINIRE